MDPKAGEVRPSPFLPAIRTNCCVFRLRTGLGKHPVPTIVPVASIATFGVSLFGAQISIHVELELTKYCALRKDPAAPATCTFAINVTLFADLNVMSVRCNVRPRNSVSAAGIAAHATVPVVGTTIGMLSVNV